MLYERNIPETDQSVFISFITNSLSLSGVFVNHIQTRQELAKPNDKRHPWIQSHMVSVDVSWKWIMQRNLIQCFGFIDWFIELNTHLMSLPCSTENNSGQFKSYELGSLRSTPPGGRETSKIPHEEVKENLESIFLSLEKYDNDHDQYIMPLRVRFSSAVELAMAAWKLQFQLGYLCPFYQGNWISARLMTNVLRCHWSLPWLTFDYSDKEEKNELGNLYNEEIAQWFKLFDDYGVLTDKFIEKTPSRIK